MKTRDDLQAPRRPPDDPTRRRRPFVVPVAAALVVAASLAMLVARHGTPSPVPNDVLEQPLAQPPAHGAAAPGAVPTDLTVVVRDLIDADYRLRVHPDPAAVANVLDTSHPGYNDAVKVERQLVAGDVRYDPLPAPFVVADAQIVHQEADHATITVQYASWPAFRAVDRSGAVVLDQPAGGPRTVVLTLKLSGGVWRMSGSERLS